MPTRFTKRGFNSPLQSGKKPLKKTEVLQVPNPRPWEKIKKLEFGKKFFLNQG